MKTSRTILASALALPVLALVGLVAQRSLASPAKEDCCTPDGWFLAGSAPQDYTACKVQRDGAPGTACRLSSSTASAQVFGTLMQTVSADPYAGKRVRLSAELKTEDVKGWSGAWMRVDRAGGDMGAFDNMQDRPLKATTAWKRYDVVLDVASDAKYVAFGVLQSGTGSTWIDNARLEVVGNDVPVTGSAITGSAEGAPLNLDFEK